MPRLAAWAPVVLAALLSLPARAEEPGWIDLTARFPDAFRRPAAEWVLADAVTLDPADPRKLKPSAARGAVLVNGPGRVRDLVTTEEFRDLAVHVEFLISRRSNSGVKLMGLYEIQIVDSHGSKDLSGDSCGGVYPRAEEKPRYHHIDEGTPPRTDAARPAGEWQTLDIEYRAPRFEGDKKVANARFVKVVLNGTVIHEDVELKHPTGAAWRLRKEVPAGPLLLQADHGPVAFRNVRVRPLGAGEGK